MENTTSTKVIVLTRKDLILRYASDSIDNIHCLRFLEDSLSRKHFLMASLIVFVDRNLDTKIIKCRWGFDDPKVKTLMPDIIEKAIVIYANSRSFDTH